MLTYVDWTPGRWGRVRTELLRPCRLPVLYLTARDVPARRVLRTLRRLRREGDVRCAILPDALAPRAALCGIADPDEAALRRALGGGASGGRLAGRRAWAVDLAACLVFIVVTYTCGCVQYAAVVGVDLAAAFAVTIAPFAIPDLVKAVAAVACARAVTRAVNAALAYAGEVQK